jgi:Tol biopolymer transport system component
MLIPGYRLGPYEVVSPLGAGGMGEVYRARDERLGREVALKVLPESMASDPDRLKRFEREARATAALSHPNVLAVFDIGSHDGRTFVVSELLDGATLGTRLEIGPLPTREALSLAAQACRGLAVAHARGIIHRDVKPDNLFLTKSGLLKILDFGLAHVSGDSSGATDGTTASRLTDAGTILGTVRYMSPEQAKGLSIDARSDLFSLGVVLYEMLAGRHPFKRATSAETMTAILRDDPPMEGSLPSVLDQIVRRCLEKDPEQRFQTARDLEFALSTLSGSSPIDVAVPPVEPKRHRRLLVTLSLFLAALVLSTVGLFVGFRLGERSLPSFDRLTFRRGNVWNARFAPDGQTIVYGASWDGQPCRMFTTRIGNRESRQLDLPDADIAAISRAGDMAILIKLPYPRSPGSLATLARVPLAGGAPRELANDVESADFSPDGSELAIVRQVGARRQLEYPIGKVLLQEDVLQKVRVSPRGDLVALDDNAGSIFVVDRQGRKRMLEVNDATDAFWSPSGEEVWFKGRNETGTGSAIFAVSLSGRKRLLASPAGFTVLEDVYRDGRALVNNGELRMGMMARAPGETQEREVSWFNQSVVADLQQDGSTLLFSEGGHGGLGTMTTYLRKTDGSSPAVRLGDGQAMSLSTDGKWALTKKPFDFVRELVLLPTGAGESRTVKADGIEYASAYFFPDGKRIVATARQEGKPWRTYIQDLAAGPPRPLLPEGVSSGPISPDGRLVVGLEDSTRTIRLYPTDGGAPRPIPGPPEPGDPWSFSSDGRLLSVEMSGLVMKVFRRDLGSGRRDLLREITPSDPAGIFRLGPLIPGIDGKTYVYSYARALLSLHVVNGLK